MAVHLGPGHRRCRDVERHVVGPPLPAACGTTRRSTRGCSDSRTGPRSTATTADGADPVRAARLDRPGPLHRSPLVLVDAPAPGPGDRRGAGRGRACGVCRTDLQLCEGDLDGPPAAGRARPPGRGPGGSRVRRDHARPRRTGSAWPGSPATCGHCRFCTSGRENLCEAASRFTGWDRDGGYATHVTARGRLRPPSARRVRRPRRRAPAVRRGDRLPLAAGRRVGPQPAGPRLGLYGFGASATCVIQVARHWGLEVLRAAPGRSASRPGRWRSGPRWAGGYDEAPPRSPRRRHHLRPRRRRGRAAPSRPLDRGGVVAVNAIHLDRVPEFPYELPVVGAPAPQRRQRHPGRRARSSWTWPRRSRSHPHRGPAARRGRRAAPPGRRRRRRVVRPIP